MLGTGGTNRVIERTRDRGGFTFGVMQIVVHYTVIRVSHLLVAFATRVILCKYKVRIAVEIALEMDSTNRLWLCLTILL